MDFINDIDALEEIYGAIDPNSQTKVAAHLTDEYRRWIMTSRFCIISTVGPEGTDASPRGDDGPVVLEIDPQTLAMPDWRGNKRIDTLRNIVRDPRVSLMFMVPGSNNVVRVNGMAKVTADSEMRGRFEKRGHLPQTVVLVNIDEVYIQCARALVRSQLWGLDAEKPDLPTPGQILCAQSVKEFDGDKYDSEWSGRAAKTMWSD